MAQENKYLADIVATAIREGFSELAMATREGFCDLGNRIAQGERPDGTENVVIPLMSISDKLDAIAHNLEAINGDAES